VLEQVKRRAGQGGMPAGRRMPGSGRSRWSRARPCAVNPGRVAWSSCRWRVPPGQVEALSSCRSGCWRGVPTRAVRTGVGPAGDGLVDPGLGLCLPRSRGMPCVAVRTRSPGPRSGGIGRAGSWTLSGCRAKSGGRARRRRLTDGSMTV